MIVMIFFANKMAWALDAYAVYEEAGWTFGEVFQELDVILEHHEIIDSYYTDLIIGYLLTAVSSFKFIVNAFKSAK